MTIGAAIFGLNGGCWIHSVSAGVTLGIGAFLIVSLTDKIISAIKDTDSN